MYKLAIFASGSGSNAENIIKYFQNKPLINVTCICTNKSDAKVIERAKKYDVPVFVFSKTDLYDTDYVIRYLKENAVEWIVLAGFLWLIPSRMIDIFPHHIINIHPALLPKFGGKGMYGHYVHQAVIDNKESFSGITIHYVNHEYDKGDVIFQATCQVEPADTPETLAARVHDLEYEHFPQVIEQEILR